jgi:hypothetical protein
MREDEELACEAGGDSGRLSASSDTGDSVSKRRRSIGQLQAQRMRLVQ